MLLHPYESYLASINRRPGTIEQRVGDITRLNRAFPDLFSLTVHDLLAYYAAHPAWSPEYRRKLRASFVMFFHWAILTNRTASDPTIGLPSIHVPIRSPRPTPDSVVLDAFEGGTLAERAILVLASTMGLRRTEIATLHPSSRNGTRIHIVGKGGNARTLTLDPVTLQLLNQLEQEQGPDAYYFPGRFGGHLHPATIYKWVKRHIGAEWTLHNCRTRAATVGYRGTKDIRAVQTFLGHRSIATTQVYVAVDEKQVAAVTKATSLAYTTTHRSIAGLSLPPKKSRIQDHDRFIKDLASLTMRARKFGIEISVR